MRRWMVLLLGLMVAGAIAPAESSAQSRGKPGRGKSNPVHLTRPGPSRTPTARRDADRRYGWPWQVIRVEQRGRKANGPAFCRSGAGHPVYGRRWCLDKGYGLGGSWGRVVWGDVVFRRPRRREPLRQRDLADVLGEIVLRNFATHASVLGLRGPLTGTWVEERGGPVVLRISAGGVPFAEIVDSHRTGRANTVLVQLAR